MTVVPRRTPASRRRLRLASAIASTIAVAALSVAAPLAAGAPAAGARPVAHPASVTGGTSGSARTVTGTVSGDHAWDPNTNQQLKAAPSVTVDQTDDLTDQVVHVTWKNFTPSFNRAGPFFNAGSTYYAVTVLQCKGTDPVNTKFKWPFFSSACYAFTANDANASDGVGNQAYTLTGADGTGETYFHVETKQENNKLGCDADQPCSIVVVPNWGGQQPTGAKPGSSSVKCANHTGDKSFFGAYALDSSLGNACSWQDRFVVPLHFAKTPDNCPARDYQFASEGAPMLARTVQQWQAGWCTGSKALTFDFDSGTNEYLARSSFLNGSGALTSATDVALVNQPASGSRKGYTYAPVADTGISIAYHIDDEQTGRLITNLTLDARLVAKLLTQSYSLDFGCTTGGSTTTQTATCDPAVKDNPVDIFDDPEFQKLNPEYSRADFPPVSDLNRGQFLPLVLNGDSDMTYELSRWIESDPAARAFISGKPDPWGMKVNSYYRGETLPFSQFEVMDPGYTAPTSKDGVPGQSTMQVTWNPVTGLDNVASSLVIDRPSGIDPTLPPCGGQGGAPCVYPRFSSQAPGTRALFAVVGLSDAAADRFPSAKLVNAGGAAVAPTDRSLAAAESDMSTNADRITQSANYASKDKAQYPLAMNGYAMVPTCGLPKGKASAIEDFLSRVASSQHSGALPGDLAGGNLPLTSRQRAQTRSAQHAVSTVACTTGARHHNTNTTHHRHGHHGSGNGGGGGTGDTSGGGTTGTTTGQGKHKSPETGPSSTPSTPPGKLTAYGVKRSDSGADFGIILPLVLLLSALLLIGGPGTLVLLRTRAGAALLTRARGLVRR